MKHLLAVLTGILIFAAFDSWGDTPGVSVGRFPQEMRMFYGEADGLPSNDVHAIAVGPSGAVYAGTQNGLAVFDGSAWRAVEGAAGAPVSAVGRAGDAVYFACEGYLYAVSEGKAKEFARLPTEATALTIAGTEAPILGADTGLYEWRNGEWARDIELGRSLNLDSKVFAVAPGPRLAAATNQGLYVRNSAGSWERSLPADARGRSWAPVSVRGAAYDPSGRLWFASPQGAGALADRWTLYTGAEGLPYNQFTCMAAGPDGAVWFGTDMGVIRYDGKHWAYRQGLRWLPNDEVRAIAVDEQGGAWVATAGGVSHIHFKSMTLAEKAAFYEQQIDLYHRRTPWEYVLEVSVGEPGKPVDVRQHDSDNDGLWTAMYGAGECFAYAATKDPKAKARATKAFEALRWLGEVTQGGPNPAPKGFVARTILPTSGPNPNEGRLEQDRRSQQGDKLWKAYEPRWPVSENGEWYWKSDTSSDELDGHFFFYGIYYDLVAETEAEKARVRDHTVALVDHLIEHGFNLVDHTGTVTRWGVFDPNEINHNKYWNIERGLNSLSMLSYLTVAEHMTGDPKYTRAIQHLRDVHAYDMNALVTKIQRGIGSGNQSDDEMAFMCYYNLLRLTKDESLKELIAYSFYRYWIVEEPELNPFFNFCFAAVNTGKTFVNAFSTIPLDPWDGWLEDSIDTLKRFPLDRYNWGYKHSHRLDLVRLPRQAYEEGEPDQGWAYRVNGKVIPVDERHFNHYNHNPFELDSRGNGRELATGTVFLLPYYMGLYHGFIQE